LNARIVAWNARCAVAKFAVLICHPYQSVVNRLIPVRFDRSIFDIKRCLATVSLLWWSGALAQVPSTSCVALRPQRITPHLAGGRLFYVEPNAMVVSEGSVVIAGAPSYVWPASGFDTTRRSYPAVFGAFIKSDGRSRAIPLPIPQGRIAEIRLTPLGSTGLAAVFAEIEPQDNPVRPPKVVAYWYGTFVETRWSRLERLPIPVNQLRIRGASKLASRGNKLAIAVPVDTQNGSYAGVLVRKNGTWKLHRLDVEDIAYVTIGMPASNRIVVGVVTADTAVKTGDSNSLFLYSSDMSGERWSEPTKLAAGGDHAIHHPEFQLETAAPAASWISENPPTAVALLWGVGSAVPSMPVTLSQKAAQVAYAPIGKTPMWVIHERPGKWPGELRIVGHIDGRVTTVSTIPNPFAAGYAALTFNDAVLIAGPVDPDPMRTPVTLEVITVRLKCGTTK